jgi:YVTN family beta-propeller protein
VRRSMLAAALVALCLVSVSAVSFAGDVVIATVPVGRDPIAVAVNPLTHMVYVANYGADSVSMIDGATDSYVATVTMPRDAGQVAAFPLALIVDSFSASPRAFVVNFWAQKISVIDEDSRSTVATIVVGGPHASGPRALAFDPTGTPPKLYIANLGSATVSVYNADTYAWIADIPVGVAPRSLGIFSAPGHRRVFVANRDSGTVSVIDGATDSVIATLTVGARPRGIAVDPNTGFAYVTNEGGNSVSVISDADVVVATIPVGATPEGVAVDSGSRRVFVANYAGASVNVIDEDSNAVVATLTVGDIPYSIAVDEKKKKAYVTNHGSGTVSIIDSKLAIQTVAVQGGPQAVATDPESAKHKVYVANTDSRTVSVIDEPDPVAATGLAPLAVASAVAGGPTTVAVTPMANDSTSNPQPAITGSASDLREPWVSSIHAVLYRLDGEATWHPATITGGAGTPNVTWEAAVSEPLAEGEHHVVVQALDDRSRAVSNSYYSAANVVPSLGDPATYAFSLVLSPPDTTPPVVTSAGLAQDAVAVGLAAQLTAVGKDADTGGSSLAGAECSLDGGSWVPMTAVDGAFDAAVETATAALGPFARAGLHAVSVRFRDAAGNTSGAASREFAVYNARGGSMMGQARFGRPGESGTRLLKVSAQYTGGALKASVDFTAPGISLRAAAADWMMVSGKLGVIAGRGRLGDGRTARYKAWVQDLAGTKGRGLVRVQVTLDPAGAVVWDSQPGAGLSAAPSSPVVVGRIKVTAPVLSGYGALPRRIL